MAGSSDEGESSEEEADSFFEKFNMVSYVQAVKRILKVC